MKNSPDLRSLLRAWPYDADNDARIARGDDDREILQVRTPVGIEQYEMDGRPDGERPYGFATALEYHMQQLELCRSEGKEARFSLSEEECSELFNEGTLFYFRYVRLFQLEDWERTVRDTSRNLQVFDFVKRWAKHEDDRQFLERWRPYILRVNASAKAMIHLSKEAFVEAIDVLRKATERIQSLEELKDETFEMERERALSDLQELLSQVEDNRPLSDLEKLENRLKRAIQRQEFEKAAGLRDKIRDLKAKASNRK